MEIDSLARHLDRVSELAGGDSRVLTRAVGEALRTHAVADVPLLLVEDGLVLVCGARPPGWRQVAKRLASRGSVVLSPAADESIVALAPTRLRALSDPALARLAADAPSARFLLGAFEAALRDANDLLGAIGHVHHVDRVRDLLLQLARTHGRVGRDGGVRIDVPLTHELVAHAVASTRETVSRAMESLERDGFVTRDGAHYRVLVHPDEVDPL